MKTAGVVIDSWKLPIFKRHLDESACTYTEHPGYSSFTIILKISYEWVADLKPVIEAAEKECRFTKKPRFVK